MACGSVSARPRHRARAQGLTPYSPHQLSGCGPVERSQRRAAASFHDTNSPTAAEARLVSSSRARFLQHFQHHLGLQGREMWGIWLSHRLGV